MHIQAYIAITNFIDNGPGVYSYIMFTNDDEAANTVYFDSITRRSLTKLAYNDLKRLSDGSPCRIEIHTESEDLAELVEKENRHNITLYFPMTEPTLEKLYNQTLRRMAD